ncbi:MAG TPA: hypothetical protein VKT22_15850 [Steroidobacteraceae bacterium]|nr:hypothetical protein [Steroidobacteraceae bacterium]
MAKLPILPVVPVRRAIVGSLMVLSLLAFPLQAIIDSSVSNLAASSIALLASLAVLLYIGYTRAIEERPLSTFAIFGLCTTTQLGALLAMTALWKPLASSLYDPVYTFPTLAFYLGIALLTHIALRFFSVGRPNRVHVVRAVLGWAGLYRRPAAGALWIMGCIGLVAALFAHLQGVVGKIAGAFAFLAWGPFLIPFYVREAGPTYGNARTQRMLLGAFALTAMALGLALNARAIMFIGFATIGLIYLLVGLRSGEPVTSRGVSRLALLAVLTACLAAPISDLATAMVIARQWRGKVPASEMVRQTFDIWRNPALIEAYRAEAELAARYKAYDENYLGNPLLERFVATKYHDNSFHFARAISTPEAHEKLREVSINLAWAVLPDPILHKLGIQIDKEQYAASMGDYLAYLSRGMKLGGHKIGSMFAQGIALFGPLFPFVYAAICLVLFGFMDLLSFPRSAGGAGISALGMMDLLDIFLQGVGYEGLHDVLYLIVRNFAQMLLIYLLVFAGARLFTRDRATAPGLPRLAAWQPGS